MNKEKNNVPIITGFLREFATIFTLIVLCMSLAGKFISIYAHEIWNLSTIFALGGTSLPYTTIMQSAVYALIMAIVSRFLFSGYIITKISFIWRYFIFFLVTLLTTSVFAIVFNWFPVGIVQAWLVFIPIFFVFFAIAIGLSIVLLKFEDKKYNRLLEKYKNTNKL